MTPLERAARALMAHIHPAEAPEALEGEWANRAWYWRSAVRGMFQAIREPSEAMGEAAGNRDKVRAKGIDPYDMPPETVWRLMIDAALEEG